MDDATLVFDFADLGGYLNSVGCSVRVGGTGIVSLKGSRQYIAVMYKNDCLRQYVMIKYEHEFKH